MSTPTVKLPGHPDKVFGADTTQPAAPTRQDQNGLPAAQEVRSHDVLATLVGELRATRPQTPSERAQVADAVSIAAERIVAEFERLSKLREQVTVDEFKLRQREELVDAREVAVAAREKLLGVYPEGKRGWFR
jgi:hypothetical protein